MLSFNREVPFVLLSTFTIFTLYFSYVKQTVLKAVKRMFQRKKGKGNFRKINCAFSD